LKMPGYVGFSSQHERDEPALQSRILGWEENALEATSGIEPE
jgi:hypothetical protein